MKVKKAKLKYSDDAYIFVREAVDFAIRHIGEVRHVSALELLENCKIYAQKQYGLLAQDVLENWRINSADDIGNIVFELIEAGSLSASPGDSREDFSIKFDLFDKDILRVNYIRENPNPMIVD